MKKILLFALLMFSGAAIFAGEIQKTFTFNTPTLTQSGVYQIVRFGNTKLSGIPGEPMLPYHEVSLLLPPGEMAESITITCENPEIYKGEVNLYPQQHLRPISIGPDGQFIRNEAVYSLNSLYPAKRYTHLSTTYLNGFAFALSTFTPVQYNPALKTLTWYHKVTVTIHTKPAPEAMAALKNITASAKAMKRVSQFTQNPDMLNQYPAKSPKKTAYQVLIITPSLFEAGFQNLIDYYSSRSVTAMVATTQYISGLMTGQDLQEKIRNYIIQEYQENDVEHVLLGGDVAHVPYRGFYCYVESGSGYEDENIPADLYYSGLDGSWNDNGNSRWGEPEEADLLPDVSVARMPFSNATELANMVHKSVSYQGNPVTGELTRPFMVGEFLYDTPMTWGQDYLELLINDHSDNGYFTHGIPSAGNEISRLYDTLISPPSNMYSWDVNTLLAEINDGKSFIHHCGHSNSDYMMRLFNWDITNQNFSQVNGVDHNYQLMYSHGCICGAFDVEDCIAEKSVTIANWLAGGVFNSRYGWFDQGLTEGPSAHLHREFISALYNDTLEFRISELGGAHMMSKIKTAPWVGIPGEFEPGAQRWCHYDCNAFGDPAMVIWTDEPNTGTGNMPATMAFSVSPNPTSGQFSVSYQLATPCDVTISIVNTLGQTVITGEFSATSAGSHMQQFNLSSAAPGIYYCRIDANGMTGTRKVMVTR
jgi:hypothetical protein